LKSFHKTADHIPSTDKLVKPWICMTPWVCIVSSMIMHVASFFF